MMKQIALVTVMAVASASFAADATFESIQKEFQHKVISLLSDTNVSVAELQTTIAKYAGETFGAHPDVMRAEAEKRFRGLPQFPNTNLIGYVEVKTWGEFPLSEEDGWVWLMLFGWDPVNLANPAKNTMLSRQLGAEHYGRRLALLNVCCPDKTYRLGDSKFPDLVVDSLGGLFVVKVKMTEAGVCKPVSVRWMKQKEPPTKP